jgi:hypothetical protein
MRALYCLLTGLALNATASQAEMTALKDFVPVAFFEFKSEVPDEQAAPIMESMSRHISRSLVNVYAAETIGSTADVSPKLDLAVLGSLGFAIGETDRAIETLVMPEIRPVLSRLPEGKSMELKVEILWADRATAERLPQIPFINENVIAALKAGGQAEMAGLFAVRWVDSVSSDASGRLRASLRSEQSLRRVRAATFNQWTPFDTSLTFEINRNGIELLAKSLVTPGRLQDLKPKKKPGILIERVIYSPQMVENAELDLANVIIDRRYSASGRADESRARVVFGRWDTGQFVACAMNSCLHYVNRVPTIHGVVQFEEHTWYQSVVGWFRSWFATHVEVRILLKDLYLTYDRAAQTFVVVPEKSQIPVVVLSVDAFGNDSKYLIDSGTQVMGVNFYESYIGSKITDGLSSDLNRSLKDADKGLSALIAQIAGSLAR